MRVGWERKTSRAARQIAVISLFLRQTDFVSLLLYPASRSLAIMSSMSNVRGPESPPEPDLPFAPPRSPEEPWREEEGRTEEMAAASPDDGCGSGLARMV